MFCFVGVTAALYLVLPEEEGQQHQHASIVDDPPHIDVALSEALSVGREGRDVLGHEQSQVSCGGFSDQLCRRGQGVSLRLFLQTTLWLSLYYVHVYNDFLIEVVKS